MPSEEVFSLLTWDLAAYFLVVHPHPLAGGPSSLGVTRVLAPVGPPRTRLPGGSGSGAETRFAPETVTLVTTEK